MSMETEIIKLYTAAQEQIVKTFASKIANGTSYSFQVSLLAEIKKILNKLSRQTEKVIETEIPKIYNATQADILSQYNKMYAAIGETAKVAYPEAFAVVNEKAIALLVENTTLQMTDAVNFVGRRLQDTVRSAGIEAITQKITTGSTVQQTKKLLQDKLISEGYLKVPTASGRNMRLDSYASLVSRTTTREVTNTASINEAQGIGEDLVKMSSHASCCSICAAYEGRVYSISGETPGYPKLDLAFSNGYANMHPNCRHVINAYIREFDDDAAATQAFSNRSFDVDPRSAADKKAYANAQEYNRELLRDRKQWENYKLRLGDDAPKTLAAFRNIKNNYPDAYDKLQTEYRASGTVIKQAVEESTG